MKTNLLLVVVLCAIFLMAGGAQAQQVDLAVGFGSTVGQSASDVSATDLANGTHQAQSIGGGGYLTFSGDFLFFKNLGVGAEISSRAHQNLDIFQQPYRPILYDINAVYAPPLGKMAQAEIQAGIGAESIRFYTPFLTCGTFSGCTNYVSSNHFLGHVGGGLRIYAYHNFFIRPEVHVYLVHNNFEFSGPRVTRYALSIGYSLRNKM